MVVPMANYCKNMDNRIVLDLIKKDLDELQTLVEALQKDEIPNQLLIDITIGRTKTLLQEFSLLQGETALPTEDTVKVLEDANMNIAASEPDIVPEANNTEATTSEPEELQEDTLVDAEIEIKTEEAPEKAEKQEIDNFEDAQEEVAPILEKQEQSETASPIEEETIVAEEPVEEEPVEEEIIGEPATESKKENSEAAQTEEATEPSSTPVEPKETSNEKKILGENFSAEPTLNERLASSKNQESKIKGKPLTTLKGAIGLNDKFMFTRELFGNDRSKFDKAIEDLDACKSLIEAIEYLEKNFKWTKNETSLKFIGLVKQRFNN